MNPLPLNEWLESCLKTVSSLRKMQAREKSTEDRRRSSIPRDRYAEHLDKVLKDETETKKMRELVKRKKEDRE